MKYILPGMGASSEMYAGPWRQIKESRFIDWPPYNGETSISGLAERLVKEYRINQNDTLIGSSLGGIVSLGIAEIIESPKVFLIGSAINTGEILILPKLLKPLAGRSLVRASQFIASFSKNRAIKMYSKSEPDFIVSMTKAVTDWEGFKGDLKRVARIHGKKDRVFRCPADAEIIEDGGHLIAITHAHECVDFIMKNSG